MNRTLIELICESPDSTLMRFNVTQLMRMIDVGIIPDGAPFELLDGIIIRRDDSATDYEQATRRVRRGIVVDSLTDYLTNAFRNSKNSVRCATPIELSENCVYEPDLTIIRGHSRDYFPKFPTPAATYLCIDITDRYVERDPNARLEQFASVAIPAYWLVNLQQGQLEVYSSPDVEQQTYRQNTVLSRQDSVNLTIPGQETIKLSVEDILNGSL